jgi:hypothetical protein
LQLIPFCEEAVSVQASTLDSELRARLNGLAEPLEIRDERGQTVGHFLPAEPPRHGLGRLALAGLSGLLACHFLSSAGTYSS